MKKNFALHLLITKWTLISLFNSVTLFLISVVEKKYLILIKKKLILFRKTFYQPKFN